MGYVRFAADSDVEELALLAAETFPLACPAGLPDSDIAEFIDAHLSPERFRDYLADPSHAVLVYVDEVIHGYLLMMRGEIFQPSPEFGVRHLPSAYLSKCYVRAARHGSGAASKLLHRAKELAQEWGVVSIWLNTNQENVRGVKFYEKNGFARVGIKEMLVGQQVCADFVLEWVSSRDEPQALSV